MLADPIIFDLDNLTDEEVRDLLNEQIAQTTRDLQAISGTVDVELGSGPCVFERTEKRDGSL